MSDFRETLYTINKHGDRKWVYAHIHRGRFYYARWLVATVLIAFYLVMPWITIGGEQGIHLDIANRKFIFFGSIFWATDTKFLVIVLASLALSLFFFTSLLGRIWCGWACPETVFLEFLFRPIEILIEGGPVDRNKLDSGPWNLNKIIKKFTKYSIFLVLAWIIASTFLAYFVGAKPLVRMMSDYPWHNWTPFLVTCFVMFLMVFQFGWFREQFCTIACPYARFQSVLLDSDSLLVGYDKARGEPRGKLEKPGVERKFGDCIDCGYCVRVCPTGIDIRNGLQLECIQCAACADACDSIMEKIGRPLGLVRYSTEKALETGKFHFIRPRVLIYAGILVALGVTFTYLLSTREFSEFQIVRQAGTASYQEISPGVLMNQFHIHISNKAREARIYSVSIENEPQMMAVMPGAPFTLQGDSEIKLPLFIHFPPTLLNGGNKQLTVVVTDDHGYRGTQTLSVIGPVGR